MQITLDQNQFTKTYRFVHFIRIETTIKKSTYMNIKFTCTCLDTFLWKKAIQKFEKEKIKNDRFFQEDNTLYVATLASSA